MDKIGKHKMIAMCKEWPAYYMLWNIERKTLCSLYIVRYGFDEKKRVHHIIKIWQDLTHPSLLMVITLIN